MTTGGSPMPKLCRNGILIQPISSMEQCRHLSSKSALLHTAPSVGGQATLIQIKMFSLSTRTSFSPRNWISKMFLSQLRIKKTRTIYNSCRDLRALIAWKSIQRFQGLLDSCHYSNTFWQTSNLLTYPKSPLKFDWTRQSDLKKTTYLNPRIQDINHHS